MKISKEGVFFLELPDGTNPEVFQRCASALLSSAAPPEEPGEYDDYMLNLETVLRMGPQPSRKASFQEIVKRTRDLVDAVEGLKAVTHGHLSRLEQPGGFTGYREVIRSAALALQKKEVEDNKKHAWVFTLVNRLIDLLNIDIGTGMSNENIAKLAVQRIEALTIATRRIRTELHTQGTVWDAGFDGDIGTLEFALARLQETMVKRSRTPRSKRRR